MPLSRFPRHTRAGAIHVPRPRVPSHVALFARRLRALIIGAGLAATLLLGTELAAVHAAFASGLDVAAAEAQFLELVNAERVAAGLQPVQSDPRLVELARWRSEDMVARNFFSHDIGGFYVALLLGERQIAFSLAGENLASNTFDDEKTVTIAHSALMRSRSHRANVLRPEFNLAGIGVAIGPDNRKVFTEIFIQG